SLTVALRAAAHARGALDPRLLAGLDLDELRRPAAALEEAEVHAQEHLRPILRLRAAGAGVDGDDGVALVVLARQLHRQLDAVDLGPELRDELLDLLVDVLPFVVPLEQHVEGARPRSER